MGPESTSTLVPNRFRNFGYITEAIAPTRAISESFSSLVLDPYSGNGSRYRRFSQFELTSGVRELKLLPHRPFVQSRKYNQLVGGTLRNFEPLLCDPSRGVRVMAEAMALDIGVSWQVNVHQIRTVCTPGVNGIVVPEGPHQDGHRFVALWVIRRRNIKGGETSLLDLDSTVPFFRTTIGEGEALLFDDQLMLHDTTPIESVGPDSCRESFIIVFNPWSQRKYGEQHERDAAR